MKVAKFQRFYNCGFSEIENMPLVHFETLLDCAIRLENQELLVQLNVMDYPNLKPDNRKKLYKSIKNRAYPDVDEETVSVEKFQQMLKQGKF